MLTIENGRLLKNGAFVCADNEVMERFFRFIFADVPPDAHCLCTGLGLGVAQRHLFPRNTLTIEYDEEIIEAHECGEVICANAWSWIPDREFDFAFHDIWSDINNVPEGDEERLMARFNIPKQICLPSAYKAGGW